MVASLLTSLQWGRVLMNAENIGTTVYRHGHPQLQWGRVLMNAENRLCVCGRGRRFVLLQWGRVLMNAEND